MIRKFRQNITWLLIAPLVFLSIVQSINAAETEAVNAQSPKSQSLSTKSEYNPHQDNNTQQQKHYSRSRQDYVIPDIALTNRHGEEIRVMDLLNDEQPVLLQFVFTTCATICPVLSATFTSAQTSLKEITPDYRMISISIDPEQDTPRTLSDYAKRFKVGTQWHLLTGSRDKIAKIQHAFDAYYRGNNKMYHLPYTYLRAKGTQTWVRLDGLLSTGDLIEEYRQIASVSTQSGIQ
ncbi:MAG: SCO family protein [Methylococcales bacterium]